MSKPKIHITQDGEKIAITKMTDDHLINTILYQQRKAKEGVRVVYGSMGIGDNEPFYDEDWYFGDSALEIMHHNEYLAEAKRRGIHIC